MTRKAWDRAPLSGVDVKITADKQVEICPKVQNRCVPVVGSVEAKAVDGGYVLWSAKKSVKYEDFNRGWVSIGSVANVKYSSTGFADVVASVKDKLNSVTGSIRLTGLIKYTPPDKVKISYSNGKSSVRVKFCFYKNGKPTEFYGDLSVSVYEGKRQIYKNSYKVDGAKCLEKSWEYSWLGPTSGGKATVYAKAVPVVGKSVKTSAKIAGLWAKVYAVGEYISGTSWYDASLMRFYVTDAKFVKRGDTYYFGIYVTIRNADQNAQYVSQCSFDAIDSNGNIYDAARLFVKGEFEGGRIYGGLSRRG